MHVVILGNTGMLGSDLTSVFREAGHTATGLDRDMLDITDRSAVFRILGEIEPHLIINAAAYTATERAEEEPDAARAVNTDAVGSIAQCAVKLDIPLVHYSTDYVFDGESTSGYDEGATPAPLSVYGETKAAGEGLLQQLCSKYYLIRTSWLFGEKGSNFVKTILRLASEGKSGSDSPLRIVRDQIGKPTYTPDLAQATLELVSKPYDFGVYHITNEDAVSWHDFAQEIFSEKGLDVMVEAIASHEYPRRCQAPKCSILLNTKFPKLRSHRDALRDYLKNVTL